jgi:ABC-type molybdate transport system substrate-binding protein
MLPVRPRLSVAVLGLGALVGLAACSSGAGGSGSTAAGTTITLYSGQHEETTGKLVAAFTAQTGIKVKVRSDDEAVLAQQIIQEGGASPADVFFTENSPPLVQRDDQGLDRGQRPGERTGLQHGQAVRRRPPHLGAGARRPEVGGQAVDLAG